MPNTGSGTAADIEGSSASTSYGLFGLLYFPGAAVTFGANLTAAGGGIDACRGDNHARQSAEPVWRLRELRVPDAPGADRADHSVMPSHPNRGRPLRRRCPMPIANDRRGVAAVEFALVAGIVVVLLVAVFDLGLWIWQGMQLEGALLAGVHYAQEFADDTGGIPVDYRRGAATRAVKRDNRDAGAGPRLRFRRLHGGGRGLLAGDGAAGVRDARNFPAVLAALLHSDHQYEPAICHSCPIIAAATPV